jgi:hypothetical protein
MSFSLFVPLIRSLTSSFVIYGFSRPPVGHVKLRCPPTRPLRVLGEFPHASRGLYDNPAYSDNDGSHQIWLNYFRCLPWLQSKLSSGGSVSAPSDIRCLCSMCHRESREEVARERERQDTGYPREIGSVDEGRTTVGGCTESVVHSCMCLA